MSKIVSKFYGENPGKEWNRLDDPYHRFELITTLKLIDKYFPSSGNICDIGSGPGRYGLELLKRGYQTTLIDFSQELLDIAKEKISESRLLDHAELICSDARYLQMLPDDGYQAVMVMGPMYHLLQKEDRIQVLKEAQRILVKGGIAIVAYLNSWGVLRYGLEGFPDRYRDKQFVQSMLGEVSLEGSFENFTECYWSTPPLATLEMESVGFTVIAQAGCEAFASGMKPAVRRMAAEQPEAYENVLDMVTQTCELEPYRDTTEHLHFVVRN